MSNPFTVISFYTESSQIVADHVTAENGMKAFAKVVAQRGCEIEFVVAIAGHLNEDTGLTFPGDSIVSAVTVEEQPEVFGEVIYDD